ncbi:MAG: hypothetical protein RR998_09205 [Oscillospiraceae bacterium]
MKKLVAFALLFALIVCTLPFAPSVSATSGLIVSGGSFMLSNEGTIQQTPHLVQGETWGGGTLSIKYTAAAKPVDWKIESVEMGTDIKVTGFPFAVDQLNYLQSFGVADHYVLYSIPTLRVRGDAPAGYYDIPIIVRYSYDNIAVPGKRLDGSETLYFRTLIAETSQPATDDGNIAKIIISNFSTNPKDVVAGQPFVLGVTFKNTSSSHTISNLKASLAGDSTFKPVSGSSTLFIPSIAPGESKSASIRLTSKPDTAPSSYNATFSLNYDAPNTKDHAPVTDTEIIAIPVIQVPKVMVTKLQIQPSDIIVGQDINVMSTVNNTGKSKIYNVNVNVSDSGGLLAVGEAYLGNIDTGGTGTIDLYITPQKAGSGKAKMTVNYEDENGTKFTYEESSDIVVMESGGGIEIPPMVDPNLKPVDDSGSLWWIWLIVALVIGGVVTLIIVKKKKAKQRMMRDRATANELNAKYLQGQSDSRKSTSTTEDTQR